MKEIITELVERGTAKETGDVGGRRSFLLLIHTDLSFSPSFGEDLFTDTHPPHPPNTHTHTASTHTPLHTVRSHTCMLTQAKKKKDLPAVFAAPTVSCVWINAHTHTTHTRKLYFVF